MRANREIRIGIAGCGEVTRAKHLPALLQVPGVVISAVCDVDEGRGQRVAKQFGIAAHYRDLTEMLAETEIDAAGICTPTGTHAALAVLAMRAGKHVWVDKPLALTSADCVVLARQAAESRTVAMTGFHMRFHRLVRQARTIIARGDLGRIESVRAVWHSPRPDGNVPDWKMRRETGGGALVEIAVHHFDLMRYLLDEDLTEIGATSYSNVRDDECATVSARMASGVLVAAEFSERTAHEIELVICGRNGTMRLDLLRFDGLELRGAKEVPGAMNVRLRGVERFIRMLPEGLRTMRRGGDYKDSYFHAWSAFANAVRAGWQAEATLEDGLRASEVVEAALESRATRQMIPIERHGLPGDHDRPSFSVVVPTYNRAERLPGLLESLAAQDYPKSRFEVVLVDDGGPQSVYEIAETFRERLDVKVFRHERSGCAGARQRGIEHANGRFLAFTDDDCRPVPSWLSQLEKALMSHPSCAVAGSTLNALTADPYAEASQYIVGWLSRIGLDERGRLQFAPTSNLAFPADEYRAMGGLDAKWRNSGGEDRDLCARWLAAGHEIVSVPGAAVFHRHLLTLRDYWRQHYHYGRGAYLLRMRDRRAWHFESAGAYLRLFGGTLRRYRMPASLHMMLLVALGQVANAWGFLKAALAGARPEPFLVPTTAERPLNTAPLRRPAVRDASLQPATKARGA